MKSKKTEFLIYGSATIVVIALWFFGIFLATTMKANYDLKIENFELLNQIKECEK